MVNFFSYRPSPPFSPGKPQWVASQAYQTKKPSGHKLSPKGFRSPDKLGQDFSYRFPTSMVPTAVSYQRSAIYLLPASVCQLFSAALANTKRHPDLRKSISTVPASSTSSRIPAITCSQRGNGAFSVVLSGLIDSQPLSIVAIPPPSLLSTPFSTHHEFPTFFSPMSRISLLLQGDLLPLAADRQGN